MNDTFLAYFDGSEKEGNAYVGLLIKEGEKILYQRNEKLNKKTNNSYRIETFALFSLLQFLSQEGYQKVVIRGDNEQLIHRILGLKKKIEQGSHTPSQGFKSSLQYQIIELLQQNKTWSLERIEGSKNEAHEVARREIKAEEYKE